VAINNNNSKRQQSIIILLSATMFTFADEDPQQSKLLCSVGRSSFRSRSPANNDDDGGGGGAPNNMGAMPSLITPTKINISARGVDEVHPLMAMSARKKMGGGGGGGGSILNNNSSNNISNTNSNDSHLMKNFEKKKDAGDSEIQLQNNISLEMSDMTSVSSSQVSSKSLGANKEGTNNCSTTTNNNNKNGEKLNSKQQSAMDNFLEAQLSGNPVLKSDAWKELVRTMKEGETGESAASSSAIGHHHNKSYGRANSGGHRRRGE